MSTHPLDQAAARLAAMDPAQRKQLLATARTESADASRNSWFLRPRPTDTPRMRLFCFPYAGSGASVFRTWSSHLPNDIEVVGIQLPGREWRIQEPPARRLAELLPRLTEAIAPLTKVPFAFFGHSMGALVAFELTRYLRRNELTQPDQLFLSAFRAPHLPNPNIRIYHLPDEVIKTVLLKEGTPEEVIRNDELMKALLPTLRADFEVCDTYDFATEAPVAIPMHIYGGAQDVRVDRDDLEQWRSLAGSHFDLTILPGSHFFLHAAQDLLLKHLSTHLSTQPPHFNPLHTEGAVA